MTAKKMTTTTTTTTPRMPKTNQLAIFYWNRIIIFLSGSTAQFRG
jgi:hypothetical protein